jgi:hypothetical protein
LYNTPPYRTGTIITIITTITTVKSPGFFFFFIFPVRRAIDQLPSSASPLFSPPAPISATLPINGVTFIIIIVIVIIIILYLSVFGLVFHTHFLTAL